jgi:hypothetical protein
VILFAIFWIIFLTVFSTTGFKYAISSLGFSFKAALVASPVAEKTSYSVRFMIFNKKNSFNSSVTSQVSGERQTPHVKAMSCLFRAVEHLWAW